MAKKQFETPSLTIEELTAELYLSKKDLKKANQMATRRSGTSASRKGRREKQKEGVPGWVQAR